MSRPPKKAKPGKARLDVLLVERGLAASRERAQAMLLAGQVRVNGAPTGKAGSQVARDAKIEIAGETLRYASRAGLKLEGALEDLGVDPRDRICLDVGSSTGGFTDCLLQHGARKVYAVDVTIDQLDWKLRRDPRVATIEKNARYLRAEDIGEAPSLVTADVSFISLTKILPAVVPIAAGWNRVPYSDQAAIRARKAGRRKRRDRPRRGPAREGRGARSRGGDRGGP